MIKVFEAIKDRIDKAYFDYVTEKEFNGEDPAYWGDVSDEIGDELFEFISSLVKDETLDEPRTSGDNVTDCFRKHCAGERNSKSSENYIRYDFVDIKDYNNYEKVINSKVNNPDVRIVSLYDTELVLTSINDITSKSMSILFTTSCGFTNNGGDVQIALNSFANDVTTNAGNVNTINLVVLSKAGKTISMYAIKSDIIESKLKNIISQKINNDEIKSLYEKMYRGVN